MKTRVTVWSMVTVLVVLVATLLWRDWSERGGYEPAGYYLENLLLSDVANRRR